MASNWQETYKKLKKRKELVDTLSGGGDLVPVKSSVSNRNIYTKGAETKLQKNTAPIKTTSKYNNNTSVNSRKNNITLLPNAKPSIGNNITLLPNTKPNNNSIVTLDKLNTPSLLDKTSLTDRILGVSDINKSNLSNVDSSNWQQRYGELMDRKTALDLAVNTTPVQWGKISTSKTNNNLTRPEAGITDSEGYTTTGLVYGDYWYQNYAKDKNNPIVEKEGKYYVYKGTNSTSGKGIYQPVDTMTFMTTKELDKKNYEEAVEQGYIGGKNDVKKIANQIKLDSTNLTDKEKEEYAEDLRRQEADAIEDLKRANQIHYSGSGLKGALGELKHLLGNAGEKIDEEIVEPITTAKDSYKLSKMSEELGLEAYKKMMGEENNYDSLKEEMDKYTKFNEDIVYDSNYLSQSIQSLPNQVGGFLAGVKEGGIGATIGATGGAIIGGATTKSGSGALAGAKTGAKALGGAGYVKGQAEYTYKLEAGMQYQTLIEMGVPEDIAKEEAQKVGTVNALIESGESILDLVTLGQASKGKQLLLNGLKKKYGIDIVSNWIGKSTIQNTLSEGIEEGIQEHTSISSEKRATEAAGIERDDSQDFDRIKDSIITGSLSSLLVGGSGKVVTNVANKAITTQQINSEVNKQVKAYETETGNKITDEQKAEIKAGVEEAYQKAQRNENGYTQNEQSVIDKEVENRIAEAEKDGNKLTNKEKYNIIEEVQKDIDKGYISTDTIESVLGGEEYNQYKSILDKQNRYNELLDKNVGETTNREKIELDTLTKELDGVDINTLKSNLDSSMANKIAKDSYLQRSYQEQTKKGQQFTYDATKITNEHEKAVYESAAKIMNDTTRSHEFVENVAKIAKDRGTSYEFINDEQLKSLGHELEGKKINGLVKDGKILINIDSSKALNTIVGHETTHLLEGTQEYQELQNAIFNYAKEKGDFNDRQSSLQALYEGIENADIDSELTADLVGDYLFTDEKFINNLSTQKPTIFQKIKELIEDLVVRFKGTKEEKQLREVQKRFKEAYKQNVASKETNTKYSFAGVKAAENNQRALLRLETAQQLEQKGTTNEDIRQQTGWFKGTDGQWRIEISDRDSSIIGEINPNTTYKLGDILQHDKLFEAYPELKNYKVVLKDLKGNGKFNYLTNTISLNNKLASNVDNLRGTLMHEVQHAIQKREGFARGTYYDGKNPDNYRNSAGEQEARNVKARLDYTKDQIKNIAPTLSKQDSNRIHEVGLFSRRINASEATIDNQGRTLTDYTIEKTKNSKVRDEQGNLMLMYHGSPDGNYDQLKAGTYFTSDRNYAERYTSTSASSLGNGKKTTNNPKIYEAYLNIEKPFDLSEPEARNIYINDYVKGGNALGINPYLSDAEYNKIENIDWTEVEDLKDFLQENGYDYDGIIADEGGDFDTDGNVLLRGKSYIPFSEEQIIKANDNNTKYSLSDKGTLQDSNGNDVTLETSETGTHGTLMAIHNLTEDKMKGVLELGGFPFPSIAIMNERTMSGNSNFGDISVLFDKDTIDPQKNKKNKVYSRDAYTPRFPSVEYDIDSKVIKNIKNIVGNDYQNGYVSDAINMLDNIEDSVNRRGLEETLKNIKKDSSMKYIYMKSVNPSFKELTKSEQYSTTYTNETLQNFIDNYDGKYPLNDIPSSEIDSYVPQMVAAYEEQLRQEYAKVKEFDTDTINELVESQTKELKEKFYAKDKFLTAAFRLQKRGANNQVIDTKATNELIDNTINQEEYNNWIDELFEGVIAKKGLRNKKDYYTPAGNRRTFDQLHYEYTLDNVVKIMTELDDTGSESSMMTGINEIAGNVSKRLTSIQDIKNNEYMLQSYTDEEYSAILEEYGDKLFNVQQEILDRGHDNSSNQFIAMDNLGSAVAEVARDYGNGKSVTANTVTKALNEYGFNPTAEESQTILNMFNEFKELPTEYFESKPKRAVKLNEVQAIVIPNTIDTEFKQQIQDAGLKYYEYDPNIEGDRQRVINQFDDLKFSLSQQNEIAPRNPNLTYGEDVKLEQTIAPLQEEIKTLTETVNELKEVVTEIAPITEQVSEQVAEVEYTQPTKTELDNLMTLQETGGTEYANTFFGLRDKYGQRNLYKGINEYKKAPDTYEAPIKGDEFAPTPQNIVEQQGQEAFNNIDESSMPSELEDISPDESSKMTATESLFETRDYEDVGNRKVNAYQYDNPEVKPYFQEEAQAMLGDLKASIKGERLYNDDLYYATGGEQGFYGTERQTTDDIAELLDGMDGKYKYTYADIEKGLNAIINDEGAENNAISKRIEFYLDQRLRNGYTTVEGIEIPANQEYIDMMAVKEMNDYYNSLPVTDDMLPAENVENYVDNVSNSKEIAPVKEQKAERIKEEYLAITPEKEPKLIKVKDNPTYNQIAEVLVNEPKTESQKNKRKWAIFKANVFDKGMVFEDLSLKENNRELMGKWDYTLTSEARGQYAIGNGHNGLSKSLNDIRAEVDNTGNTKDFYNYMYHKHNVDRMTLASRFEGMENKPVFGDSVTAEQSQAIVNQYEKTHPEFMDFAQDVYDYVNADRQLLVDNGVISQETADLWSQMYPHYVPTRRTTDTGMDINVPLDTRKTGINAPIKKATGGSADILPLFDTMAMRTLQTYRATAKNSFGVELMNTLGTKVETNQTNVDEVIDSIDAQDGLLQEGKKGKNPTFTVFENGEKHTFEITKDMYDALRPLDESSLLSKTIKPLNIAGNIRRGLLTEYNPTFMLTNAIKDTQDILINSQHVAKTYSKIPEAHKQLLTKGYWYQEYVSNGGEQNSYFDNETNTFKTENKGLSKIMDLPPLSTISKINNHIEMIPRLAEYIASRESGRSIEVSMLDAARVTTNFKAGGAVTKWANRNGATFLNASVQGAMQQVRNIREAKANGVRGWVNLATKFAIAGLPAILLNNLVWEDDEEYEELSDYVKQNYYVVGKTNDGTFIRIPKGRTVAVIQEGINQMSNLITGDDEADLKSFIDLAINNLAPNNPLDNNIFSPIVQVATNTAWYGGDLLPTRLKNLPASEQYDESTDMFSRWIGETFNVSPYKVNYLLDQYSGGVGDLVLPMMTPEAESDGDSLLDYAIAPLRSKFTTNSTFNNQNVSDFYNLKEELTVKSNKTNATDEDILKNKYINSVNAELSSLYQQKREIQNSNLSNSEKYKQAKEVQEQINELAKNALSEYTNVSNYSNYSTVGDREYYKKINSEGEVEWTKVDDEEAEDLNNLSMSNQDKNIYFKTKSEISEISKDADDTDDKKIQIIDSILSSGMADEQKAYLYGKHYSSDKTLDKVTESGISFDDYLTFSKESLSLEDTESKVEHLYNSDMNDEAKTVIYETSVLSGFDNEDKYKDYKTSKAVGIDINSWLSYKKQEFVADKDEDGKSISGSRKEKIFDYIDSLDIDFEQKVILEKLEYPSYDDYNYEIIEYLNNRDDISYEEEVTILKELGFEVDSEGNISWD